MTIEQDLSSPPPLPDSAPEWHYVKNNEKIGPVPQARMGEILRAGGIAKDTLVWKHGMAEWVPLSTTALANELGQDSPPPLPPKNTLAWIIAFVPLIGMFVEQNTAFDSGAKIFGYIAAYTALCAIDSNNLRKGGHLGEKSLFIFFVLVPLYLYRRARLLGQKLYYFFAWFVAMIITIAVTSPALFSGAVYWGEGIPSCDSAYATNQVAKIFGDIPAAKLHALNALDVNNATETSSTNDVKSCAANVHTSAGTTVPVAFTLSRSNDTIYVRVQIAN